MDFTHQSCFSSRREWRSFRAAILLALALPGLATRAAEPPADFPRPDEYYDAGRTFTYIAKARDFLRENPKAECAPRVAFDLLVVATVERNQTLGSEMSERLVLNHPESLYTRYALAALPDVQQFRQFLAKLADGHWESADERFCRAWCQAVRQGLDRWGPQLLTDDSFLLNLAVLADAGHDGYLRSLSRTRLEESNNDKTRQIAQTALDARSGAVEKVLRLHAIEDDPAAARMERFFFSRLTAEEKSRPEVVRAAIEGLLEAGKLAAALPLLQEQAARKADPQLLFWLAWCQAALGQKPQALASVANLEKRHPQDPWTGSAQEIAHHIQGLDERLHAAAGGLLAAAERLRRPETEAFEGHFVYCCEDGREVRIYLGFALAEGRFELAVGEGDRMVLAYQVRDGQGRIYFDGEPVIHVFRGKAKYPLFAAQAVPDGKQGMNFNWNFNFHDSPQAMAQSKDRIQIAPELLTREAIVALLRHGAVETGRFPAAVEIDKTGARYAWVRPLVRNPGFDRLEYRIAGDGTLTGFRLRALVGNNLRYGPAHAISFSPPRWPDRPVVLHDEMDPSAMFRAMAAVMSLMSPPKATAHRGTPERR